MRERIYKGATRPAMVFGIPLKVLVPVDGALLFVLAWGSWLASKVGYGWMVFSSTAVVMVVLNVWMRAVTGHDDQRLLQLWKWMRLQLMHRNRGLWKCRSYSPIAFQDSYDEWFH
jgi:type IV secretion system protein VirB3